MLITTLGMLCLSGGEGKTGTVMDLRGWDAESGRSCRNVALATSAGALPAETRLGRRLLLLKPSDSIP